MIFFLSVLSLRFCLFCICMFLPSNSAKILVVLNEAGEKQSRNQKVHNFVIFLKTLTFDFILDVILSLSVCFLHAQRLGTKAKSRWMGVLGDLMLHAVLTKLLGKAGKIYMQYRMSAAWKLFLEKFRSILSWLFLFIKQNFSNFCMFSSRVCSSFFKKNRWKVILVLLQTSQQLSKFSCNLFTITCKENSGCC